MALIELSAEPGKMKLYLNTALASYPSYAITLNTSTNYRFRSTLESRCNGGVERIYVAMLHRRDRIVITERLLLRCKLHPHIL